MRLEGSLSKAFSLVFRRFRLDLSAPKVAQNIFGCRIFCRLLEQSDCGATQELIGKACRLKDGKRSS